MSTCSFREEILVHLVWLLLIVVGIVFILIGLGVL